MNNVQCPYEDCGESFDYTDYGDPVGDGDAVHITCEKCDRIFIAYASYSLDYLNETIAPCLNGEPHEYEPRVGVPIEHFIGRYACKYCDEERQFSTEEIAKLGLRVPEWWTEHKEKTENQNATT